MKPTAFPVALLLWALFVIAGIAGLIIGLAALPFAKARHYTSNIVHAQDCATAAFLGWSGRNTVSKECGLELRKPKPCRFCRFACAILNKLFESEHCRKAAE